METASRKKLVTLIVIGILFVAAFVRLFRITAVDVTTDEALIGVRSIGYLDFMASPTQKTPPEWYDPEPAPAWTKLSFHDHPPLTFLLQHLSFKIFGENLIGLRAIFVLAGIASVWLAFFIGRKLFSETAGLLAAGLLALSAAHTVISRIGLQESLGIFFVLLAFYFFLRTLEEPRWWLAFGAAVGGGILVKYTTLFYLPALFVYLLLFRRDVFRKNWLWLGAALAVLLASPVILYNFFLFQKSGHFDLQLSYLLKQPTPEWTYLLGKVQIGTFTERLKNFPSRLLDVHSVPTLLFAIFALIWAVIRRGRQWTLFILVVAALTGLLFVVGPQQRFIAMYAPFFALGIGALGRELFRLRASWLRVLLIVIAGLWILYEGYFLRNTVLTFDVPGKIGRDFARMKFEAFSTGYVGLNTYLDERLGSRWPAVRLAQKYVFLERMNVAAVERAAAAGKEGEALLVIMDENVWNLAGFWTFTRRSIYQGWPILLSRDFIESGGAGFYAAKGFEKFLFVRAAEGALQESSRTSAPEILEKRFIENKVKPVKEILNPFGGVAFRVYEL
ncbi:glycosyltransferase family 39 protein [Candidatus Azambacteria bacterium]|nr:glycosyltransferase family 39 protein [Candidatus Azambacteria bacterium]